MTHRLLFLASFGLVAACAGTVQTTPPATAPTTTAPPNAAVATTDPHYLLSDDYLVRVSRNNDVTHVAKQLSAPTEPGGEGVFLSQRNGQEIRSALFFRTRPATGADASVGATLFCFEGNWSGSDEIRHGPRNADEARGSTWIVDRVTDTTELGQGIVRVGRRRCSLDAIRVSID